MDSDGNITYQHDTTPVRQVVSEETSAHVRECLEYVVSDGTGRNGQVKGYRVGGKPAPPTRVRPATWWSPLSASPRRTIPRSSSW